MRRPITLVALAASLALFTPAVAVASPSTHAASARVGTCNRTIAHYPVLLPGARRPAVRTLQCVLNDDGYGPVAVDGFYGPQTRAAVRRVEDGFEGPSPHPGRINNGFWVLLFGQHLPDRDLRIGDHGPARAARAAARVAASDGPVRGCRASPSAPDSEITGKMSASRQCSCDVGPVVVRRHARAGLGRLEPVAVDVPDLAAGPGRARSTRSHGPGRGATMSTVTSYSPRS